MPNLLYKTVAPVVTFFTSGPTAETSPAKINHREVSHPSIDARAGSIDARAVVVVDARETPSDDHVREFASLDRAP